MRKWLLAGLSKIVPYLDIEKVILNEVQAEMNGNDFNYMGHSSYEAAMAAFAAAEAAGKTQMDLVNEVEGDHDPNRMGQCGERSC